MLKAHAQRALPAEDHAADGVVTFENPSAYARTIRATALVFEDARSRELLERLQRFSQSDATVLIVGETGTGKELIARQIHRLSARSHGPFVAVNCAALPEHLVESELFGHEKGAFTGAIGQKKGWFETASGGTLFLDEVGDLPVATQVKMLRALQEREITRVGGRSAISVDIRFLAATNVNLEEAVQAGRFREDLYYRLNVAQLSLPPLRERPGDILPLVDYFVRLYQDRLNLTQASVALAAKDALLTYPWPGNIRELENVVHHALLVMRDGIIQPRDLNLTGFKLFKGAVAAPAARPAAAPEPDASAPVDLGKTFTRLFQDGGPSLYARIDEELIRTAFAFSGNNQVKAAQLLGISRNILRHRLKLYHLI